MDALEYKLLLLPMDDTDDDEHDDIDESEESLSAVDAIVKHTEPSESTTFFRLCTGEGSLAALT